MYKSAFNVVWLSLLYRCNNRCEWCYAGSNHYDALKDKILPEARQDEILGLLAGLRVKRITLIGGEPTIYPNVVGLIRRISELKLPVGMVTNGRRLKDREFVRQLKANGLRHATVSIEGSTDAIHDGTTGVRGSLGEALQGIRNAQAEGLGVSTNTVISSLNVDDLENIVDLLRINGVETVTFNVCGVTIANNVTNRDLLLRPFEAARAFERAHKYAKDSGVRSRLITPLPRCNFDNLDELKEDHAVPGGPCQLVSGGNFVIDYNGDVLPCTHFGGYPLFNVYQLGTLMSAAQFLEAYDSTFVRTFRKEVSQHPSTKCSGCNENCAGGCPIYWLKLDPEEEIRGHANRRDANYFVSRPGTRMISLPVVAQSDHATRPYGCGC